MGDFILLKDDNLPQCDWHLCRVLEVYKSKDNKLRSVKLLVGQEMALQDLSYTKYSICACGIIKNYLLRYAVCSRHMRCVYSVVIISC